MKKFFFCSWYVFFFLILCGFTPVYGANITSAGSGDWSNTSTWVGGVVPGSTDAVFIGNGHTINLDTDASCASLSFNTGGTTSVLNINTFSLQVAGTVSINRATSNGQGRTINIGSGYLSCASISTSNPGDDSRTTAINVTTGTLSVSGNISFASGTNNQIRNSINYTGAGRLEVGGTISNGDIVMPAYSNSTISFNGSSSQTIPVNSTYSYCNLEIDNSAGVTIQNSVSATFLTGNISIIAGTLTLNTYTITGNTGKTFTMAAGSNLSLTGTAVMPSNFSYQLHPQSRVIYQRTNSQTITAIASPGYGILELAGTSAKTPGNDLFIQHDLIIGGSATFAASGFTHRIGGDITNNSVFSAGTSTIILNGPAAQNITGNISCTFNNLTIDNGGGVILGRNQTINGILNLTAGVIRTGVNSLMLSAASTVSGGSDISHVYGNLSKAINAGNTTKTFETGDGTYYNPVSLTFTAASNSTGRLVVSLTTGDHPHIATSDVDEGHSLNDYWTIQNIGVTGITSYSAVFTFSPEQLDPAAQASQFKGDLYSSSSWSSPAVGTLTPTSTQLTGMTVFGDFQLGQKVQYKYRSNATGVWNNSAIWQRSRDGSTWTAAPDYPDYTDGTIELKSPFTVTITGSMQVTVDELTIQNGANLTVNVNVGSYSMFINDGPGDDIQVEGILDYQDDKFQFLGSASMDVGNTGIYRANFTYGTAVPVYIPIADWNVSSTLEIVSTNQLVPSAGLSQSFGNVTWNYPAQTANINLGGLLTTVRGNFTVISTGSAQLQLTNTTGLTMTVGGDMVIQGGTTNFASGASPAKVLNISGNFNQTGGTFTNSNSNILSVYMKGSGKTFSQSGGTLTNTYTNWIIETGASISLLSNLLIPSSRICTVNGTLDCGESTYISGAGTFVLSDNAHLLLGSPDGLSNNTTNGNIRTTVKTLSQNASFTFNGTGAQITGTGMPSGVKNLTVSNAAGVTLSGDTEIKTLLSLVSGALSIGSKTISFGSDDIPIIRTSGTLSTGTSSVIRFGSSVLTGGAAFTLPSGLFTSAPTVQDLINYRSAGITLNDQRLSVAGTVLANGVINTNNNLTLISDASKTALIDGSGAAAVSGNVTVQRYLSSEFGYHYLSSPVSNGTVGDFSPWIDLGAGFTSFYYYDENNSATGWTKYTNPSSPMDPLNGYCGNFGTEAAPVILSVTGPVNNGPNTRTLYNHNRIFTKGFNLAGNPYPSPVNWDAASGWTKTNIDNAVYYFNTGSADQYTGTYSSYINGISSDGIANGIIPAFQGFFVHVSAGSYPVTGTLGMTNSVRVNNLNPVFHKSEKDIPLIRISGSFEGTGPMKDYLAITLTGSAIPEFDPLNDALKLINTDDRFPSLFVLKNDQKLSICSGPGSFDTISYPLGFVSSGKRTLNLKLEKAENIDDVNVYLFDRNLRHYTDLKAFPEIPVNAAEGENTGRYSIILSRNQLHDVNPAGDNVFVYGSGGSLFIFVKDKESETRVTLYDISGRKIWEDSFMGTRAEFRPGICDGIYVVSCMNDSGSSAIKIFYNR